MSMSFHCSDRDSRSWRFARPGNTWHVLRLVVALCAGAGARADATLPPAVPAVPGCFYTNQHVADPLWSIHVVRIERSTPGLELRSVHAGAGALGLSTLSAQIQQLNGAGLTVLAGVNGDFYQRDRAYAGDPRGLQIRDGEVLRSPADGASLWVDAAGQPHVANVVSQFQLTWPDGTVTPFGLNGARAASGIELFSPAIGASTRTTGGRELILEAVGGNAGLPLHPGESLMARVREIRPAGDTALQQGTLVVSIGPAATKVPEVAPGATLRIVTATVPDLRGARTALSGGPVLVRGSRALRIKPPSEDSYEGSSMLERHPRSAIGWNGQYYFLVEVDGRQASLSVGMTLAELAACLARLGCEEAMNLDGGGSATLWFAGAVRNRPCDGHEREIANALLVVKKLPVTGANN